MDGEPKALARLLKALGVENRVRIVQLLKGRSLCVNALADRLEVTQGAVSQHLRVLRDAGLVIDEKRGYFVHYRLNEDALAAWREAIDRLLDTPAASRPETEGEPPCAAARRTTSVNRAARSPKS